jgi:hypothetical protein
MKLLPILPKIAPRDDETRRNHEGEQSLIRLEAKIGGQLFGPIPAGHQREFFCLDEHTWVWHESWTEKGQNKSISTRYEVRPTGVLKCQDGQTYRRLSDSEARNLYKAVELYRQRVSTEYQRMVQASS